MTRSRLIVAGLAALLLTGCGDGGPELCEVEGIVTLDGAPVPDAELTFVPQNVPTTMVSYGKTDSAGRFTLAFTAAKTGALPATHHVRIDMPAKQRLPKKYAEEGSVTAEVKEGHNDLKIELSSK